MRQRNCRMQKLPEFVIMLNFVKSVFQQKTPADRFFCAKDSLQVFVPDFPGKRHTFPVQRLPGGGLKCPYFFSKWVRLPSKPDLGMGFATFSVLGAL